MLTKTQIMGEHALGAKARYKTPTMNTEGGHWGQISAKSLPNEVTVRSSMARPVNHYDRRHGLGQRIEVALEVERQVSSLGHSPMGGYPVITHFVFVGVRVP